MSKYIHEVSVRIKCRSFITANIREKFTILSFPPFTRHEYLFSHVYQALVKMKVHIQKLLKHAFPITFKQIQRYLCLYFTIFVLPFLNLLKIFQAFTVLALKFRVTTPKIISKKSSLYCSWLVDNSVWKRYRLKLKRIYWSQSCPG